MTPLGFIIVPLGLILLLNSREWLYRCVVFSVFFSATVVLNVGSGDNASGLQVWMYFASLWLAGSLFDGLRTRKLAISGKLIVPTGILLIFLFIAMTSLFMPLYINGRLAIASPFLFENFRTPLYLTSKNFTQLTYLVFGAIIGIAVAHCNLNEQDRHRSERIFLFGAVFAALWGLLQFACNITGLLYPAFIFNNSLSKSAGGFLQAFTEIGGLKRVSSVAVEPSMLAQTLLCAVPLTFPALLGRGAVFGKIKDRLACGLLIFVLAVTTSSIAYIGLALLVLLSIVMVRKTRVLNSTRALLKICVLGIALATALLLSTLTIPFLKDYLNVVIFTKASGGSAVERAMTVSNAFDYFIQYPLLGVGWGSVTSHDLLVKLLSNSGVIGATAFTAFLAIVFRRNYQLLTNCNDEQSLSRLAWTLSFSVLVLTSVITEFPFTFGHFWFAIGMAIATSSSQSLKLAQVLNTSSPVRLA